MRASQRVPVALFVLRLGVFILMAVWTIDKFVNPGHAVGVYQKFYFISVPKNALMYAFGGVEALILIGFLIGFQKRWTYGAVLLFHGISTLSAYQQYMDPFNNLLFFAAWPALAACFALYYLRDLDTLLTVRR